MCEGEGRTANSVKSQSNGGLPCLPLVDLELGDPVVFVDYWRKTGDKCSVTFSGDDAMSYIANGSKVCWFLLPELEEAIKRLHSTVGNAVCEDRYVVVGTGSTQLYQAALFALTTPGGSDPISVVSAAPFYSAYPDETDYLRSGLYKWGGDASGFEPEGAYIEVVNYPNNPDGQIRDAVVANNGHGMLLHDLAYYWPHFTPITHAADHDIMHFTFSKCTGHAGCRIGWALVKDKEVARKMTKFVEHNSIGVSKESQARVAKIMGFLCDQCENPGSDSSENFFEYSRNLMAGRWKRLRSVVGEGGVFSLPEFPEAKCSFLGDISGSYPGFAWLKCGEKEDCAALLREHNVVGRTGLRFGSGANYARLSVLSTEALFAQFLHNLSTAKTHNGRSQFLDQNTFLENQKHDLQ